LVYIAGKLAIGVIGTDTVDVQPETVVIVQETLTACSGFTYIV